VVRKATGLQIAQRRGRVEMATANRVVLHILPFNPLGVVRLEKY